MEENEANEFVKKLKKFYDDIFPFLLVLMAIGIFGLVFGMGKTGTKPLSSIEEYPIYSNQEPSFEYYKNNFLNDKQKRLYESMLEEVRQFNNHVYIEDKDLKFSEIAQVYDFVKLDHPELFWIGDLNVLRFFDKAFTSFNVWLIFDYKKEDAIRLYEDIKKVYEPIIEEGKKLSTDREKSDFLYNKLKEMAHYDSENNGRSYYNIVSIFRTGKTKCVGYAHGYKFLADRIGLKAICVDYIDPDQSDGNSSHIWNMVQIDGVWYNLDIGFDDEREENAKRFDRKYYLVSNDEFYKDHVKSKYLPNE